MITSPPLSIIPKIGGFSFSKAPLEASHLEKNNLVDHPDYSALVADFREEVLQKWNSESIHQNVILSQKKRMLISSANKQGIEPKWDHQPFFDANKMYMRNNMDLDDLEKRARYPQYDED